MIIPPIKSKGTFEFKPPFDKKLYKEQEYTVIGVRLLLELSTKGEKPYETIYKPVNISEQEFMDDVNNNVPIIVFSNSGGETFNVPANRIASQPMVNGIRYQEKVLAINLGNLPVTYDLTVLLDVVKDAVYDTIGIKSTCKVLPSSSIVLYNEEEHLTYVKLLENAKSIDKSNQTRLTEALETIEKQQALLDELEKAIINKTI